MSKAFQVWFCDHGGSVLLIRHHDSFYLFDCWMTPSYSVLHPKFYFSKRVHNIWVGLDDLPNLEGAFLSSVQNDHSDLASLAILAQKNPGMTIWSDSSILAKVKKISLLKFFPTSVGKEFNINESLKVVQLKGHGGSSPYILQDHETKESICIAPHGINLKWMKKKITDLRRCLKLQDGENLFSTLFIGITPVLLKPFGHFQNLMPDGGINIPYPAETLELIEFLKVKNIYPIHQTHEERSGWATQNLIEFPWKTSRDGDDIGTEKAKEWLIDKCQTSSFFSQEKSDSFHSFGRF